MMTLFGSRSYHLLLQESPWVRLPARALIALLCLVLAALLCLPWLQNTRGDGQVIAFSPQEREQDVNAPKSGRIVKWHIQEGQAVKKGQLLVELSDNDPNYLKRLESQRAATQMRIKAAKLGIDAITKQIKALEEMKPLLLKAADAKVKMARFKVDATNKKLKSQQADAQNAQVQQKRRQALLDKGLISERTFEFTDLKNRQAKLYVSQRKAELAEAQSKVMSLRADRLGKGAEIDGKIAKARADKADKEATLKKYEAEELKLDTEIARLGAFKIRAPQDGVVRRQLTALTGLYVKSGEALLALVPEAQRRAVELYIDGNDAALLRIGQTSRVQFEGWPAVQFSGWPQISIGTFEAKVVLIDPSVTKSGKIRVVLMPSKEEDWPQAKWLRQGGRVHGWIFLGEVSLGYELWRQLNGFPPQTNNPEDYNYNKNGKKDKKAGGKKK